MYLLHPLAAIIGLAGLCAAAGYAVLALISVFVWHMRGAARAALPLPAVTVLKPLCGAEPNLYEHLRSFCRQDYPEFQIVFGVRDRTDPACSAVRRLVAEFPSLRIDVVVNPQQHGSNYKTSNLINMLAAARHDILVMADSDVFVEPDYLASVTAPLADQRVGMVTCMYLGVPTRRIWSRLGAMYVNEWYAPSVLLARLFGHQGYASGQTLCLRRDTLQAIGGLQPIASHLAEDYRLGELIREQGLRTVMSHYMVKAEHHELSLDSLTRHEIRWMRTIRALRPRSFLWLFSTFSLPLAVLGMALTYAEPFLSVAAWTLFGITAGARVLLHFVHRLRGDQTVFSDFWLLPVRDLLTVWVWCRCFLTSQVTWRGSKFDVDTDGIMRRVS